MLRLLFFINIHCITNIKKNHLGKNLQKHLMNIKVKVLTDYRFVLQG